MGKQLYVTNLSAFTTEAELTEIFAQVGPVVSIRISTDRHTGAQLSYAFLEMETLELSQAAVEKVHGMVLHDRKIQVKLLGMNQTPKPSGEDQPSRPKQRKPRTAKRKPI